MTGQPIEPIAVQKPVPSILTTARDRTSDSFATRVPVEQDAALNAVDPGAVDQPAPPSSASWRTGVAWTSIACVPAAVFPQCPDVTIDGGNIGPVSSKPFWIETALACPWAFDAQAELITAAAAALTEAHSAFALAQALWMGTGLNANDPDQPTLRRDAIDISGGITRDLDDAVALLLAKYEDATGGSGGATLHVPSILMTGGLGGVPGGGRIAWPEGNFYRGPLGSLVSPGPGYPNGATLAGVNGAGPLTAAGPPEHYAGNSADELWVYVSGPVEYALGDLNVLLPSGGQRLNIHEVWAQRQAIFRFDPCTVFAARAYNSVTVEPS